MAELVDALVSEASEETHGGSSPLGHTILLKIKRSYYHEENEKTSHFIVNVDININRL